MNRYLKHILFSFLFLFQISYPSTQQEKKVIWDGHRTVPVHNILLKDEFDEKIIPTESYPLPYSNKYTCAPCHDYNQIQQGLHFNALSSKQDGRPGEPWFWVDRMTGTVLPLSYRDWPGIFQPGDLGLTFWEFTLLFGRHMTGGGISEPKLDEISPHSRWNVSGTLEINCMSCHNNSRKQNHSEWAFQILRENFRWASTAASGLGEVGGMASRLPGTWDLYDGPNPDDTEYAVVPYVRYDQSQFNSKHEVFFDINYKADDERCLACHSVSPASQKQFLAENDVHTSAGVKCVDCHRNDITHVMIRGYEGESEHYDTPSVSDFTCRGCHLREKGSKQKDTHAGRLGAPYPTHPTIPPIHLERLSCTACHSGSVPQNGLTQVKTSRANRLEISGIARWGMDYPIIQEPVYKRDSSGKLTPHRLIWPSFWGIIQENEIKPLKPSAVERAAGSLLNPESEAVEILSALASIPNLKATPVFISSGRIHELNVDGRLNASDYSKEIPKIKIFWALKKNNSIRPLIPEFDPESEPLDRDLEYRIQDALEALKNIPQHPGEPALIYKNKVYQIPEGYLEKKEWAHETQKHPRLCWIQENEMKNLISDFNLNAIIKTSGYPEILTEEQVEKILLSLSKSDLSVNPETNQNYVYVSNGRMFQVNQQGILEAVKHPTAEPVLWPLAHPVRPLQQSLGINGCLDCHSLNSKFYFAKISGTGPLKTKQPSQRSALSFMEMGWVYQKIFGFSFYARPLLKGVLLITALVMSFIILIVLTKILGFFTGLFEKRK
ncbi:MAG: hypothetical protein ACOC5S_00575 [Acidobacteriota bacterium]